MTSLRSSKSCDPKIKVSQSDLGYIAGFLEGEGCFHISHPRGKKYKDPQVYLPVIMATQKDPEALVFMKNLLGFGRLSYKEKNGRKQTPIHLYHVKDRESILKLIKMIYPHIKSRRIKRRAWGVYHMAKLKRTKVGLPRLTDREKRNRRRVYRIWNKTRDGSQPLTHKKRTVPNAN